MAKEAKVKASIVTSAMSFVTANLGEPALETILASFDSSEIAGKRLLPSDWVPEKAYRDLLIATTRCLESTPGAKKPKEFFFEMGKFAAIARAITEGIGPEARAELGR